LIGSVVLKWRMPPKDALKEDLYQINFKHRSALFLAGWIH
jgi:hypothetical protein